MEKLMKKVINNEAIRVIESILYILSIVFVVIINIYGSVFFKFIPLLFFIGIIGKLVFNRPFSTTLFGFIVSVCIYYISGVRDFFENLTSSFIFAFYIGIGEVFALLIKKTYTVMLKKDNSKYNILEKSNKKEKIIYMFLCGVVLVLVLSLYNFMNSNYFSYSSCEKRLDSYLKENNINDYKIISISYNILKKPNFEFYILNNDECKREKYYVFLDKNIDISKNDDENVEFINNMNSKIDEFIKNSKIEGIEDITISAKYENNEYILDVKSNYETSEDETNFSKLLAKVLDDENFKEILENFERVKITLNNYDDNTQVIVSYFYVENYLKYKNEQSLNTYVYINNSITIEYVD